MSDQEIEPIVKKCRCGSKTHKNTNHSSCPYNRRHGRLDVRSVKQKQYRETNKKKEIADYFEIARQPNFKKDDVFGQYVQSLKDKPHYGRHLMPKRTVQCPFCEA